MSHLSLRAFELTAKKAGIKRVSKDALEEARDVIEEMAVDMAEHAIRISRHAGRKTVRKEDIEFLEKRERTT